VLAVHHTGKGAGTGQDAMRGASAIAGRVRCANQVVKMPKDTKYDVKDPSQYRAIVSAKQNYMPSDKEDWLQFWSHHHEATDAWYPAVRHVVLNETLSNRAVADFCDGKRATFDSRSAEAIHKLLATQFDVKPGVAKVKIQQLEKEGVLRKEDRYNDTAGRSVPYYVSTLPEPDIPF
jgi:hypothetical protein